MTEEETGCDLILKRSTENEITGASYDEIFKAGLTPAGANYAESIDGINFYSVPYQFHVAENPSIYPEGDGTLTMYAGYGSNGVWSSESVQGPWRRTGDLYMSAGKMSPSTECPSMFDFGGYRYLIAGRTGYWRTQKGGTEFIDEAEKGYDVYDGLMVPMVKVVGERMILGGWLEGYGWGSLAVHRELVQDASGRLYMRWLPELAPRSEELEEISGFELSERESYYLEAEVRAEKGARVGVRFKGECDSQLLIDTEREIAEISNVDRSEKFAPTILPLYEAVNTGEDPEKYPFRHDGSRDFAIGRLDHLKETFKLRVVIYYEKKFDSVVIDAEIDGKRTIISNRTEERYHGIAFDLERAEIENAKLYLVK